MLKRVMGLLPGRVTYVIDRTGTVRHVFNSMTNIDGHVTEALEVVRQLQAEQPALPGRLPGPRRSVPRGGAAGTPWTPCPAGSRRRCRRCACRFCPSQRGWPPSPTAARSGSGGISAVKSGSKKNGKESRSRPLSVADPVRRRPVPAAGQPVEHVADVADERARDRRRVDPAARGAATCRPPLASWASRVSRP